MPYYKIWDEVPYGMAGSSNTLMSVAAIDKTKETSAAKNAVKDVKQFTANPVVLLNCNGTRRAFRHISDLDAEVAKMKIRHF